MSKENNRKAVLNELKKHVTLIENPNVKQKISLLIEEDQKKNVQKNKQ